MVGGLSVVVTDPATDEADDFFRYGRRSPVGCDDRAMAADARAPRKDAAANRERILDTATGLVHRHGEKVPMADIAAAAGVGVGTLYRHFATREDLLSALVHRSFGMALANARAAAAEPGPAPDGVRSFLAATLRDRARFVLPLHGGPVVFRSETRALQAEVRSVLQGLIDRGQEAGELRPDLTPVDLIVAASLLSRPLPNAEDWDALAHRQIDLFLHGLAPPRA
jgi:AcrR family transcriptional regulator